MRVLGLLALLSLCLSGCDAPVGLKVFYKKHIASLFSKKGSHIEANKVVLKYLEEGFQVKMKKCRRITKKEVKSVTTYRKSDIMLVPHKGEPVNVSDVFRDKSIKRDIASVLKKKGFQPSDTKITDCKNWNKTIR